MIIYPAIDLRRGRCVRLLQGRKDMETVYGQDPVPVALRWKEEGAKWLHVVNLDGAFADEALADQRRPGGALPENLEALRAIVSVAALPVQFGGGLRSSDTIAQAFDLGVTRVILGTAAVENPDLLAHALQTYGAEHVAVGIDAREGMVVTHGWEQQSQVSAVELARRMRDMGVRLIIYTDVARDGMLSGVNVEATSRLAAETGVDVIASGGVSTLAEIEALRGREGIEGAIIGRALYTGDIHLPEAIAAARITD